MIYSGTAWKFGDDIDTDLIIPSQYLDLGPEEYTKHVMEPIDPEFPEKVKEGDVILAGKNFGAGSSREHAVVALKALGIAAIVAESFSRIFFRNAINQGLAVIESEEAVQRSAEGDELEIDLKLGKVRNLSTGEAFEGTEFPDFILGIIAKGGAIAYYKDH
ncbi:3-isopropylmalate dehydratase small subunit [Chloroflexota bacterium]